MDFGNNTKTNDGDINDFLYSGGTPNYNLPADPGSSTGHMTQPMNRPDQNSMSNANNAADKIAMMNRLKEQ